MFWVIPLAFQIWMLIDCIVKKERYYWIPIIFLLGPLGASAYVLVVFIPPCEVEVKEDNLYRRRAVAVISGAFAAYVVSLLAFSPLAIALLLRQFVSKPFLDKLVDPSFWWLGYLFTVTATAIGCACGAILAVCVAGRDSWLWGSLACAVYLSFQALGQFMPRYTEIQPAAVWPEICRWSFALACGMLAAHLSQRRMTDKRCF